MGNVDMEQVYAEETESEAEAVARLSGDDDEFEWDSSVLPASSSPARG